MNTQIHKNTHVYNNFTQDSLPLYGQFEISHNEDSAETWLKQRVALCHLQ